MSGLPILVVTFYRFTTIADPAGVRRTLAEACASVGVKGTILIAREGINATIAGSDAAIGHVLRNVRALPGCADLGVRASRAPAMPFHRTKVRIKREIVTMGQPEIDPLADAGHRVAPRDWNALIDRADTIVIDTRNDYEVAIGSFARAIDPGTRTFRDFPGWFRTRREALIGQGAAPKVAMFCTGGIRCEKATAFLKAEGVDEVYHLAGGILAYLDAVAADESRWQGECFVFDQRVTVAPEGRAGSHTLCHGCRMPVGPAGRASPLYVEGVNCPRCHAARSEEQRAGYAERHRQALLAEARGEAHVGAVLAARGG